MGTSYRLLRPSIVLMVVVLAILLSHRATAKQVFRPVALGAKFNVDEECTVEKRDVTPVESIFGFSRNKKETLSLEARDLECRLVHNYKDKCKFVRENCADEEVGFFDYLDLFYCRLPDVPAIPFLIMTAWLGILFTTIGIAASDFFCINLSTISNILGMSESLAGVTFLAFGNGSPDVFSTFAAMKINSGSLAVGELIGAASFIATVVAGSMAIVRPFRVGRRPFVRDVSFFILAVLFAIFFLADGKITMWESVTMIFFYVFYVCFVVTWHWATTRRKRKRRKERSAREHYTAPEDEILAEDDEDDGGVGGETAGLLSENLHDFDALEGAEGEDEDDTGDSEEHEQQAYAELSNNMRIGRTGRERRHSIRPSLVGALEFRAVLHSLQKTKNLQSKPIHLRRYSDDPFHALRHSTDSAPSKLISSPRECDEDIQPEQNPSSLFQPSGRVRHVRAVSVNDAAQAKVNPIYFRPQYPLPGINLLRPSPRNSQSSISDRNMRLSLRIPAPDFLAPPPAHGFPSSPQNSPTNSSPVSPLSKPLPYLFTPDAAPESASSYLYESPRPISNQSLSPPSSLLLPPPSLDTDSLATIVSGGLKWKRMKYWPYHILPPPQLLSAVLFPTLSGFWEKSLWEKVLGMIAVPSVFLLTITLPVCEGDGIAKDEKGNAPQVLLEPESPTSLMSGGTSRPGTAIDISHTLDEAENTGVGHKEWNRWLVAVQCVTAPLFIALTFFSEEGSVLMPVLYAILGGLVSLLLLLVFTSPDKPPHSRYLLCFVGFAVSISWISTVANEVVGVLKAFGVILGISDAILGLTIFAVGNSLGDLVADITVARLGYPVMALSACFGGPMLNILLGVGISGLYMTLSKADNEPYKIEVSSTIIISAATLLLNLVMLLVAVPMNNWRMSRRIGWTLIAFWVVSTVVNLIVELTGAGKNLGGNIGYSGF
ncbi:hypothetical protein RUND412_009344 [Rhizina undulata]